MAILVQNGEVDDCVEDEEDRIGPSLAKGRWTGEKRCFILISSRRQQGGLMERFRHSADL
jgi:hypothetical protein